MRTRRALSIIGRLRPVIGAGTAGSGRRPALNLFWRRRARRAACAGPPVIQRFSFTTALTLNVHLHPAHPAAPEPSPAPARLPARLVPVRPLRREGRADGAGSRLRSAPAAGAGPVRSAARRADATLEQAPLAPPAAARPPALAIGRTPPRPAAPIESRGPASPRPRLASNPLPTALERAAAPVPARRLAGRRRPLASMLALASRPAPFPPGREDRRPVAADFFRSEPAGRPGGRPAILPSLPADGQQQGRRRLAPVDLVWRSGHGGGVSPSVESTGASAATPAAAQPDAPSPASVSPATAAAAAPPLDRLVDEVVRRLERSARVERERRGL
ncbi:MAG TPA: hypothetical protein VEW26_09615 [Allosphingosinicella sp.]|nr:hypothetical protein [Allosphingosinicella sp.]